MRNFESGATRDGDDGKLDYEGFLSPMVLQQFAKYMHKNRIVDDGKAVRDSDNWQKGIPTDAYAKSLVRHMMDFWLLHRGALAIRPENGEVADPIDTLCAIIFNAQGYMFELLNEAPPEIDWSFENEPAHYVVEADPDLERLLQEEEEIERQGQPDALDPRVKAFLDYQQAEADIAYCKVVRFWQEQDNVQRWQENEAEKAKMRDEGGYY